MKFAKAIFGVAGVWGLLTLTPLYFIYDSIGRQDPPPITHPGFYYGFAGVGLAWQLGFFVIASNPSRFRPMMIPAVAEKIGFGAAAIALYVQHRLSAGDLALGCIDLLLAALFIAAFRAAGAGPEWAYPAYPPAQPESEDAP